MTKLPTIILLGITFVSHLLAAPVPKLDVPSLVKASDMVVIGKVFQLRMAANTHVDYAGSSVSAHVEMCDLRVDTVLKGEVTPGILTFSFVETDTPIGYSAVPLNAYGIFFLQQQHAVLSFTNPYYGGLSAIPDIPTQSGTPLDNVTWQLAAVVSDDTTAQGDRNIALFALSTIPTPASTQSLKAALDQANLAIRLNAAGFLLQRNNDSAFAVVVPVLLNPGPQLSPYIIHNIAYAICKGITTDRAIPTLIRLLRAANTEVRRSAACALAHTGSVSAVPGLADALYDSDFETQYYAVLGMADITQQTEWRPNMEVFASQKQKFLKYWREWASAQKK